MASLVDMMRRNPTIPSPVSLSTRANVVNQLFYAYNRKCGICLPFIVFVFLQILLYLYISNVFSSPFFRTVMLSVLNIIWFEFVHEKFCSGAFDVYISYIMTARSLKDTSHYNYATCNADAHTKSRRG